MNGHSSSASVGGMDLLDLGGGDSPAAPAPQVVQKIAVLKPTDPGQNGENGFGIMAALTRESGAIRLLLTFSNSSPGPLNGLAIQVNKNSFGIGPGAALTVPDLAPGSSSDVILPMNPGTLPNNQLPTNPLYLQVAIKNSMDIFYFNVPFELPVVLIEAQTLDRDAFSQVWQTVGEPGQSLFTGNMEKAMDPDAVKTKLALDNVHYVARRNIDDSTSMVYFAGTTTNNLVVCAELAVRPNSPAVKVVVRTQTPQLVPLFQALVCKRLGISR